MPVDKDEFRGALSRFASGVTVVTARCEDDCLRGLTVSAFTSVSLDPPLVLVCIEKRASLHDFLKEGSAFAVNILSEDQELISRRFASKEPDRFSGMGYHEAPAGSPVLNDVLGHMECKVVASYPGGDHTIIVGEVESTSVSEGKPLAYYRGGYNRLG